MINTIKESIKMSQEIKEVIEAIDKDIQSILTSKDFDIEDVKMHLIDLWGIMKDLWLRFEGIFSKMLIIKEIEEATEKGELYEEKTEENQDLKNLYL